MMPNVNLPVFKDESLVSMCLETLPLLTFLFVFNFFTNKFTHGETGVHEKNVLILSIDFVVVNIIPDKDFLFKIN